MIRKISLAVLAFLLAGCAVGPVVKVNVDPTEQWLRAGKKVDFAVAKTKEMIQRAHGTAYVPDLYMRLADLYSERARYAWLVQYERQRAKSGEDVKAVESPEARLLKNLAIGTYGRVLREFPTFPKDDEALFLSAHEYRELGDFDKMKETYEKLITTYPTSAHLLEVYLALGDSAFDASDVKNAEKYYNRILSAPISPTHALARYKLAWIRVSQADCRAAVVLFETILKEKNAAQSPTLLRTQKNLNVIRESLIDLAYCYPEVYPEKPPVPYFRALATSSVDYLAAMRRLANRFAVKELRPQAAVAFREVLDGAPGDDDNVETVRRFYDSIVKGNALDHPGADVQRIIDVLDARLADYRLDAAARAKLVEEFELYARDVATRAQVAAKAAPLRATLSLVADGYKAYLTRFDTAAAAPEMRENWAEALMAAKRFYDAGRAYGQLQATAKTEEARKAARLNSIAAYQQALDDASLARVDRVSAWGALRSLGMRVIAETPADPAILGIKLSVARSYYEAGDYEGAANLFYAVARQYPTATEGVAAAQLSLDSLRLADNLEGIATLGRRLVADARLPQDLRNQLNDIVVKAGQRQVEEVTASDSSDREAKLLALAKSHKGSQVGEEALYDSVVVAKSSGEIERFYQLGDEFLASYPASPHRGDVLGGLASVASDAGDFVNAAKYMVAGFKADPQGKDAADRLYRAAAIHAVLGDQAVVQEAQELIERGNSKVDELLLLLARSGGLAMVDQILSASTIETPNAAFFRGFTAFQHGDYPAARKIFAKLSGTSPDLTGRARFLVGEMAYAEFRSVGAKADILTTIDANVKALGAVEKAFRPVVEGGEVRWAMAGLARVADADAKFAAFLRGLELPANLSLADQNALKTVLGAQAAGADKRAAELRGVCVKAAKKNELFSEAAKSCLLDRPLPDTIPMYAASASRGAAEPPAAAPLHRLLLKNTADTGSMMKLAELHLGLGDGAGALLLLERAEQLAPKSASVQGLQGLALYQLNDPQEAGEAFKKAVALEPSNGHAHMNLAAHFAAFGHTDRARSELQKSESPPSTPRGPADHPDVGLLSQLAAVPASPARKK